ncbi:MAG: peptide chain release factor N(5)-glutamine methyltransferase [Bacteroidales bacterium]|nr:peptide chain release factor N(5)-glutamine methyltransferase [Bacteroidales bacterium]MCF6342585.1 peptide chain release factor N(5)-glutamine methyltransferase [Bacteroidales bacterium]
MPWSTNKLPDLKQQYERELLVFYEKREAESLLAILIQHFFGLSRSALITKPDFRLSESEILKLHFAVKDLKKYRPVQYIVGEVEFFDLKIKVNETVLIPRPETEELVQLILDNEKKAGLHILDVGTGSGCIAIALAKNMMGVHLTAVDVSPTALEIAKENSTNNCLGVRFKEMDILNRNCWEEIGEYDLIVSNPPYVTENEKSLMKENVLNYEPHSALFVPDEAALIFYKAILGFASDHLTPGGKLYFEINEDRGKGLTGLLKKHKYKNIKVHKDIHGKDRFVSAEK